MASESAWLPLDRGRVWPRSQETSSPSSACLWVCSLAALSPSRKRNAPVHLSRRQTAKEAMVWAGVLAARVRQLDLGALAPACQAFPWPWGGRRVPSFRPLCPHSPTQSAAALAQQTKAQGSSCYTHTLLR